MSGEQDNTRPATGRFAPVADTVLLCLTVVLVVGTALLFGAGDFSRVVWGLPGVAGYPITRRQPDNPVGWCLIVAGAASGVAVLGTGIPYTGDPDGPVLLLMSFWGVSVSALCTAVILFRPGSPPHVSLWSSPARGEEGDD